MITRRSVIASLAALVVAPLDALAPSKPKTHGIVFDGVDDLISLDDYDHLTPIAKMINPHIWIIATDRGYKSWNGEEFVYTELPQ